MNPFALGVRAVALYNEPKLALRIEGSKNVPAAGPILIAARHYHHLYDGVALVLALRRQPHIFVALDWARSPWVRLGMETVCNLAEWPVALRADNLDPTASARVRNEAQRYARTAIARAVDLLRRGETVVMFPEGYPTIDPAGSRKPSDDAFLPFRSGISTVARRAARNLGLPVPIVPAGLAYRSRGNDRYDVTLRFGVPLVASGERAPLAQELERAVRELSLG